MTIILLLSRNEKTLFMVLNATPPARNIVENNFLKKVKLTTAYLDKN